MFAYTDDGGGPLPRLRGRVATTRPRRSARSSTSVAARRLPTRTRFESGPPTKASASAWAALRRGTGPTELWLRDGLR